LKVIGNSSIDIFPIYTSILMLNGLNYDPRPVVQSYSVYSVGLDELNALHFFDAGRPEYAMIWNMGIDNRYAQWDESITKAVLHLNYEYRDFILPGNDTTFANITGSYLLLKSKDGVREYPKFERLYGKTIDLGDTLTIDFPADEAIYMTADIEYNTTGKIINLLFQPPLITVTMFLDSARASSITRRVVRPLLNEPVLINKAILDNAGLQNFMTGNLKQNPTISAFSFHATGDRCSKKIKLAFYRFVNY
jgi:hypothetical protein